MRPLYIFDLDGTLALVSHRQHILDEGGPDRWRRYFAACVGDKPNPPVIATFRSLACHADVQVWSGRSDEVKSETRIWLSDHIGDFFNPEDLRMREAGNYTPDEILKKQWLDAMPAMDRKRLVAIFDDRNKVVNMWREVGVSCFQVAEGDF